MDATLPQPQPQPYGEALFYSVRSALAFAYSIDSFPIVASVTLMPCTGGSGRLASLSAHEKHAQGAMIRQTAERRLSRIDMAVMFATYGSGQLRAAAANEVAKEVARLIHRYGLGMELARRQMSIGIGRRSPNDLARQFGLSLRTVTGLDKRVGDAIEAMRLSTEGKLEDLFVRAGISESV